MIIFANDSQCVWNSLWHVTIFWANCIFKFILLYFEAFAILFLKQCTIGLTYFLSGYGNRELDRGVFTDSDNGSGGKARCEEQQLHCPLLPVCGGKICEHEVITLFSLLIQNWKNEQLRILFLRISNFFKTRFVDPLKYCILIVKSEKVFRDKGRVHVDPAHF